MNRLAGELRFLLSLWRLNISSAMEYRVSFISQALGMMVNDAIMFTFWILFFHRFSKIGSWQLKDMLLLFSIITTAYGIALGFFGNCSKLADHIARGRLDYYLVLPRNVLLHILASRSLFSAWGDLVFGIITFIIAGPHSAEAWLLWALTSLCSAAIMVSVFSLFGSLSFWMGNAAQLAAQLYNSILALAMYPGDIYQGGVKFVVLTVLPAALIGAVPLDIVKHMRWESLPGLALASLAFIILLSLVFYRGLRRYESGSAMNVNI
ncbi:MAG: ABC-2 family transporter protein [Candidatus Eremiobacteraeota bacterium]|nr:ABC-2 family transporter protein [Candidatus Eremiobacteraeota bacterium]